MKNELTSAQCWKSIFFSYVWLFVLLLLIDILSKWLIQLNFQAGQQIAVIPGFFYIYLTYNTGAAFSAGAGLVVWRIIYIVISWLMSGFIAYYYFAHRKDHDPWLNAVLAVLEAGSVGNLIDRTFYWEETVGFSGVIDFLQFYVFGPDNSPFATFNVADSCLTVGVIAAAILLVVRSAKDKSRSAKE
jgi:signal peptidase II